MREDIKVILLNIAEYLKIFSLKIFLTGLVLFISIIVIKVSNKLVKKIFDKKKELKDTSIQKRLDTLYMLLISTVKYIVYGIAAITIFTKIFNVFDLSTVLTAAGIGGIAFGFGAQTLVKDIISGFFILLENQLTIGDLVTIGDKTGTVEELELRIVKLRNYTGVLYTIPYGEVRIITNQTRGDSSIIVDIKLPYNIDNEKVNKLINEVISEFDFNLEEITETLNLVGVVSLDNSGYTTRIMGKAKPLKHWDIERELRKRIISKFINNDIELGAIKVYDRDIAK